MKLFVAIVIFLSIILVGLVVQYNLIEDDTKYENRVEKENKKEIKKYLENLEGYTEKKIEVKDATKEDFTNSVVIEAEQEDALDKAIREEGKDPMLLDKEEINDTIGIALDSLDDL